MPTNGGWLHLRCFPYGNCLHERRGCWQVLGGASLKEKSDFQSVIFIAAASIAH